MNNFVIKKSMENSLNDFSKYLLVFLLIITTSCKITSGARNNKAKSTAQAISSWKGIKQFGSSGAEPGVRSIAHDSQGNVYVAGVVLGTTGIDALSMNSSRDIFLIKYNSIGAVQWTKNYGSLNDPSGWTDMGSRALVVDSSDNIYIIFSSSGPIDTSVSKIGDIVDSYVVKLDKNGNKLFVKNFCPSSLSSSMTNGGALDSFGNLVITGIVEGGSFEDGLTWGTQDGFILKLNRSGVKIWSKQIFSATFQVGINSIAIDSGDNMVLVGDVTNASGGLDGLVIKLNSSGTEVWRNLQAATGISFVTLKSLVVDSLGVIYIVGIANNSFNGHTMIGACDSFLYRVNPNGANAWVRGFGNNASTNLFINSIVTDGTSLFLAGSTDGPFQKLSIVGYTDSFIVKVDPGFGDFRWIRQLAESGGSINQGALDIQFNGQVGDASLFIAGDTRTALGDTPQSGLIDSWIAKFDSKGTRY